MKAYNFDEVVDRSGTHSFKYDLSKKIFGTEDILSMWIADMDFKTPDFIVEAIKQRADHEIYGYTLTPESFYNSLIDWMKIRHQWEIKKSWISFSPGIVPAVAISVLAFSHPGDKIIIQPPVYSPFASMVKLNGRQLENNALILKDGQYKIDFEDLERRIDSRTRMIIFCSPQNPTGRVWEEDELRKLGEICVRKNILILTDEIHCDLVYADNKHIPFASLSEDIAKNCISTVAPTKTFNVPGLYTSAVVIPNLKLKAEFDRVVTNLNLHNANVFGLAAWDAAYQKGHEWLDQLLVYLKGNIEYVKSYFSNHAPKLKVIDAQGTYLLWLDFTEFGMTDKELRDFMIHKAKVGTNDGPTFGPGGNGFQRLNIGVSRSIVEKACERIANAIKELNF